MFKIKGISGINIALGIILILGGSQGHGWMFLSGLVLLFSGLALVSTQKRVASLIASLISTVLFVVGFTNGMWLKDPLGLILSAWGLISLIAFFTIHKLRNRNAQSTRRDSASPLIH